MTRDERGSALVEVSWLAILLMVPLLYIVLAVFDTQRAAFGATEAARAAARAVALADSEAEGRARAEAAAALAMADQGLPPGEVTISCDPTPCLGPGSTITVTIRTNVDLPLLPEALGDNTPSVRVESVHRVPVGTYVEAGR